jgi:CrcB protein
MAVRPKRCVSGAEHVLQVIAIAGGGAVGALLRYWVSGGIYQWFGRGFPWGTLAVNVVGSFLMGLLFVLFLERSLVSPEWRAAILVGLLGAFTTFSTFSIETLTLLEQADYLKALLNVLVSVVSCILACAGGLLLARQL